MNNEQNHRMPSALTRRDALRMLGAAGVAGVAGCNLNLGSIIGGTPACVLTPDETEGPYFVDELLNRSDIRSDPTSGVQQQGTPLQLTLNVKHVSGSDCVALSGAVIDIWHCNASGQYSDVAQNGTVGQKWLRGYQTTDASGVVQFTTIVPGWYTGRTVHIHAKARLFSGSQQTYEFTTQFYFEEATIGQAYAAAPYNARPNRDRTNANDSLYHAETQLVLTPSGSGYASTFDIGLET